MNILSNMRRKSHYELPNSTQVTTQSTCRTNLKIASWNVNGMGGADLRKLKDEQFLTEINKYDIVALLETHCPKDKTVYVPGYYPHMSYVTYKGKKEIGGIALLIRDEIKPNVSIVKENEDFLWFKLDKFFFSLERDLYICAAYIPPEKSKYLKRRSDSDILSHITEDIAIFSREGHIMLMGDLNARTAEMKEYISEDSDKFVSADIDAYRTDQEIGGRKSQDNNPHTITNRGKELIDLCIQSRLRILNGRCLGDTFGYYTCHRSNGSSVVDYMIVNEELLNRILCFKVHMLAGALSDHCMISSLVKTNFKTVKTNITTNVGFQVQEYLWKEGDIQNFQTALVSPESQQKINEILGTNYDTNNDSNSAVMHLSNFLTGVANNVLHQTHTSTKTRKIRNKPWFDKSLFCMRKEVTSKAKLLSRFPNDPNIRGSYYKLLKKYNKTRKYKQRAYKQDIVNKLDNMRTEKPSEFWKVLNLLKTEETKDNPATNIGLSEWGNYFRELNHSNSESPKSWTAETKGLLANLECKFLDETIREKEIITAIAKLKNKKAQGPDKIRNEMLKYSQHVLLPCISKVFNLVLRSGVYPDEWAQGYISPLFKSGNPFVKDNYRGITITSCLGKLFNSIINSRLEKFLSENRKIPEAQIAYKANSRTSDHVFLLKTLVDKRLKLERKQLFACFVDFKKAFDSVQHEALFLKLARIGIGGKIQCLIKDMYKKTRLCVKINKQTSTQFQSNIGVRQGDNLSPNLFKIFTHDLVDIIDERCDAPKLTSSSVGCLLFADDAILLSTSAKGLQTELNNLQTYCKEWGLTVNTNKTKTMVFNTNGKNILLPFQYENKPIESVKDYKYLGTLITSSGTFTKTTEDLYKRGLKAFFKLRKQIAQSNIKCSTYAHLFDTMVKPILLYGSEVWAPCVITTRKLKSSKQFNIEEGYKNLHIEKLQSLLCRTMLGVNAKTTLMALYSETGRFPLYIDAIINSVNYLNRLESENCSKLLAESLECNKILAEQNVSCWYSNLQHIKDRFDNSTLGNTDTTSKSLRGKLKCYFSHYWYETAFKVRNPQAIDGCKLRTYHLFKTTIHKEKYLDILPSKSLRSALARFRISSHNLNIETGRYQRNFNIETGRYQRQAAHERVCKMCNLNVVEDELHFLVECPAYIHARERLFAIAQNSCANFNSLNNKSQLVWLLSAETENVIRATAEFLRDSFSQRNVQTGIK